MRLDVAHKFEDVEVWQRALEYADPVHEIVDELSKHALYESRTTVAEVSLSDSRKESG